MVPQENNASTFTFNNSLISQLKKSSKQDRSNPILFKQRINRLNILLALLNHNAEITFCEDKNVTHNKLYNELLSLISYNVADNTIKIDRTPFYRKTTLQLNRSLLCITTSLPLTNELKKTISNFLNLYTPYIVTKKITTKALTEEEEKKEKEYDETTLLANLPYNTQKLLLEIFDDMDNVPSQQGVQ